MLGLFDFLENVTFVEGFGPYCYGLAQSLCQTRHFGLMVDETTDRKTDKQLVVLARVYTTSTVETKFLDMPVCNDGTAAGLFQAIDGVLR